MTVLYESIFGVVREFMHDEAIAGEDRVLARYLKPDLVIVDDMVMRRHQTRSTMSGTKIPNARNEKRSGGSL